MPEQTVSELVGEMKEIQRKMMLAAPGNWPEIHLEIRKSFSDGITSEFYCWNGAHVGRGPTPAEAARASGPFDVIELKRREVEGARAKTLKLEQELAELEAK